MSTFSLCCDIDVGGGEIRRKEQKKRVSTKEQKLKNVHKYLDDHISENPKYSRLQYANGTNVQSMEHFSILALAPAAGNML